MNLPIDRHFDCMKRCCRVDGECRATCNRLEALKLMTSCTPSEIETTEPEMTNLGKLLHRALDQRASAAGNIGVPIAATVQVVNPATQSEAHPPASATPRTDARATYTPEAWRLAEWAIPLHTHPTQTDTWDVPNCAGDWKPPTPERVRRYIAQAIFKFQREYVEPLERELAEAKRRADHAYPYPDAEDWTVEELGAAYARSLKDQSEYARQIGVMDKMLAERLQRAEAAEQQAKEYGLKYATEYNAKLEVEHKLRDAVAQEREACALACMHIVSTTNYAWNACNACANAIRARSKEDGNG